VPLKIASITGGRGGEGRGQGGVKHQRKMVKKINQRDMLEFDWQLSFRRQYGREGGNVREKGGSKPTQKKP